MVIALLISSHRCIKFNGAGIDQLELKLSG